MSHFPIDTISADTPPLKTRLRGVNLFLIGMMGSGKSTTGQVLAEGLGYRFMDTDAVIEQLAGQTISELFAQAGEAQFRQLETQVLAELSGYQGLVIATGGGIVLDPMNWSYLHHGLVIWLNVAVSDLLTRLAGDTTRPLLANTALAERLTSLAQARQPLYQQADLEVVVTADQSPEQVCQGILSQLPRILRA